MAFSTDAKPTTRNLEARALAALDAAISAIAILPSWRPTDPSKRGLVAAEFATIRNAALRIDRIIHHKADVP